MSVTFDVPYQYNFAVLLAFEMGELSCPTRRPTLSLEARNRVEVARAVFPEGVLQACQTVQQQVAASISEGQVPAMASEIERRIEEIKRRAQLQEVAGIAHEAQRVYEASSQCAATVKQWVKRSAISAVVGGAFLAVGGIASLPFLATAGKVWLIATMLYAATVCLGAHLGESTIRQRAWNARRSALQVANALWQSWNSMQAQSNGGNSCPHIDVHRALFPSSSSPSGDRDNFSRYPGSNRPDKPLPRVSTSSQG